ncbi:MAG TPA: pantoate--beta-alanine ligase [Acidimicrobiia bacterium]|jgi:pantoate--beta-alanine ligase|nr:pantoate--beta-alanine ligase [Acidimicrobiia bacterium]
MLHVDRIADLRATCDRARRSEQRVGVVPTMGFLHDGHRSLMRAARATTDFVVVTIFVNPLQFGAGEDLDTYPRDLAGDLAQCAAEDVDCVFSPSVAEMYPRPPLTTLHVAQLSADLCGAARPTHFDGVTTVVAKLFAIVGPCAAFFGRKDAQQLAVVTRMADDLNLPVDVVGCPIVREPDGLAMSSRNAYLSSPDRQAALVLSRALHHAADLVVHGERDAGRLIQTVRDVVATEPRVALEYVEMRDAHELTPIVTVDGSVLIAVAAQVGQTRLIDNVVVRVDDAGVTADLGITGASSTDALHSTTSS